MKKNLVVNLFTNDRIKTTLERAKEIRGDVDRVITWAKRGDVHSRRLAIAKLGNKDLVAEIFSKVEQGMFEGRPGGYSRILRLGMRRGDSATIVIMELVQEPMATKASKSAGKDAVEKTESRRPFGRRGAAAKTKDSKAKGKEAAAEEELKTAEVEAAEDAGAVEAVEVEATEAAEDVVAETEAAEEATAEAAEAAETAETAEGDEAEAAEEATDAVPAEGDTVMTEETAEASTEETDASSDSAKDSN
jgi:large subunit ribosomal protein L17